MSYRHEQTRKGRRAKTPEQLQRLVVRDTRFCQRWGIPEWFAWNFNRFPDQSRVTDVSRETSQNRGEG